MGKEAQPGNTTVTIPTKTFTPVHLGRYTLPNRLVMSPMTRSRAQRLQTDAPMDKADQATFFAGAARGFTDYLSLEPALSN